MGLATDFRSDIGTLLSDIGQAATLRRIVAGTYDVTTGTTSSDAVTDYVGTARLGNYKDIAIDGTLIKQGDRMATFQADDTTVVPQVGDYFGVPDFATDSDMYSVISFKRREIGGTVSAFTLQIRK